MILNADARHIPLPDESVYLVVPSPPVLSPRRLKRLMRVLADCETIIAATRRTKRYLGRRAVGLDASLRIADNTDR